MSKVTSLPQLELRAIGQPLRRDYLLEQADYSLALAAADGPELAALLREKFLEALAEIRDEVAHSVDDKVVAAAETKLATGTQNEAARELRLWARAAVQRVGAARRAGVRLPSEMTYPIDSHTVPGLLGQANQLLSLLVEHAATLDSVGAPTQPLIDRGRALAAALTAADKTQEQTRAATLPAAVAAFFEKKGELYTGIKILNHAGHELHAHDPAAAARYNLSILYRRRGRPAAVPAGAPAASAPTRNDTVVGLGLPAPGCAWRSRTRAARRRRQLRCARTTWPDFAARRSCAVAGMATLPDAVDPRHDGGGPDAAAPPRGPTKCPCGATEGCCRLAWTSRGACMGVPCPCGEEPMRRRERSVDSQRRIGLLA